MKKKLLSILVILCMILSLAACGSAPKAEPDENGNYVARGNRNIKINGENMKPLLAKAVKELEDVTILNRINITDYIVEENEIKGAFGFSIEEGTAYEIRAKNCLLYTSDAADEL